eukprot:5446699-Prymnesium_polylepis.1
MTTLGVTFPGADESVKYAVKQMNSTYELARKGACSPGGGMKEMHQVMLFRIGEIRKHSEFDQLNNKVQSCDELKFVENAFSGYKGPTIPYFDEWKSLLLSMESDVIGLACSDNKLDKKKAMDNFERITISSYKSICGSDEAITAMSQEAAMESAKLAPQLAAASEATSDAAAQSGLNVDPVKEAVAAISCPSGLAVLTTHYQIMLAVLFAGFALAFIALKSNSRNLK